MIKKDFSLLAHSWNPGSLEEESRASEVQVALFIQQVKSEMSLGYMDVKNK